MPEQLPVDSTLIWDPLADQLARRAFVVFKIRIRRDRRLKELTNSFREVLAKEFTPTSEAEKSNFPPTVFELLNLKKLKLLEEERAQRDASNSAHQRLNTFLHAKLYPDSLRGPQENSQTPEG